MLLEQAELHLRNKDFEEALKLLVKVDQSSLSGDDIGRYCLLMTEVNIHLGNYGTDLIDSAIETFRYQSDSGLFARAKLMKGLILICLGKPNDAKEILLESYTSYLRCNDSEEACVVLNRLAQVHLQVGEVDLAIANLQRCIALESESSRKTVGSKIEYSRINMAYLMFTAGRLQTAIDQYRFLTSTLKSNIDRNSVVCWFMSALPKAAQGDFNSALEYLKIADAAAKEYRREQIIIEENYGFVLLAAGRGEEAERHLLTGLGSALKFAPESALVSQIKRLLADCYIAKGKLSKAQKFASEAREVAEKIGQKVEIAACHRVFAQIAAHNGNGEEARREFKFAIELFSQISSRYELAVTRYLAAASGQFEQGESLAMLYLAKEYCEAEQVAPYLEKINSSLAKLEPRKAAPNFTAGNSNALITRNKRMLSLLDLAAHVAPSNMTVLLTGETGTGKDLLAQWIHEQSGRTGRFVSQNFAALPSQLAESELFGYRKGAFTGAAADKPGLFEAANSGTFFLNEIAEAPLELQAKLLEVIETRRLRRLGETTDRSVDIRMIAATNHDLAKAVRENRFRADLYHRLNEINITLPPLADRMDDLPDLIAHFVKQDAGKEFTNGDASTLERLTMILSAHSWPGNVRELRTFIRKLLVIAENDLGRLPEIAQDQLPMTDESQLVRILEQNDWNQSRAAEMLGVSEGTIRKRIRKFGLDRE